MVCERDTLSCWLTLKASNISCYNKKWKKHFICSVLFFGLVPPYDSLVVVTEMNASVLLYPHTTACLSITHVSVSVHAFICVYHSH